MIARFMSFYKPGVTLEDAVQVLDACRTRLQRARGLVRPGAVGLLKGVEHSRITDSAWHVPYLVTTTKLGGSYTCIVMLLKACQHFVLFHF